MRTLDPAVGAALLGGLLISAIAAAADLTAKTESGAAVLLHDDGTWSYAPASPESPAKPPPPTTVSVATCEDGKDYISVQLSLRNDSPDTLDSVHLRYAYFDGAGKIVSGADWIFSDVRAGKMVTARTMAVRHVTCAQIQRVELGSATCRVASPYPSDEVECLGGLTVGAGALRLTK